MRSGQGSLVQRNCCEKQVISGFPRLPEAIQIWRKNTELGGKTGVVYGWRPFTAPDDQFWQRRWSEVDKLVKSFGGVTLMDPLCIYISGQPCVGLPLYAAERLKR